MPRFRGTGNGGGEVSATVAAVLSGVSGAVLAVVLLELAVAWLADGLDR